MKRYNEHWALIDLHHFKNVQGNAVTCWACNFSAKYSIINEQFSHLQLAAHQAFNNGSVFIGSEKGFSPAKKLEMDTFLTARLNSSSLYSMLNVINSF